MSLKKLLLSWLSSNKPVKHSEFPALISTDVVPTKVMTLSEYIFFINTLTDWRQCSLLLCAVKGEKWAVNHHIKDWYHTALVHDNNRTRSMIRKKFIMLKNKEHSKREHFVKTAK